MRLLLKSSRRAAAQRYEERGSAERAVGEDDAVVDTVRGMHRYLAAALPPHAGVAGAATGAVALFAR
ncbi:hypothetical protein ACFVYF_04020 [Streptomyces sp. NPDC058274]|uniref:hypothetical protein n=1 Tax=Streptomyces sp. NPDC058274 TaxID=3346416 RepID=UPI0036EDC256